MSRLVVQSLSLLALCAAMRVAAADFDVTAFGATGNGTALDTAAINKAIETAAAAGGGTVRFPAGKYLSFSIRLRSHVTLQLDPGSIIIAAEPPADRASGYDAPEPRRDPERYQGFGHSHWHNSLIWGEALKNVAIVGAGRIYGYGLNRGVEGEHLWRRDLSPEERRAGARPDLAVSPSAVPDSPTRGRFKFPQGRELPAGIGNKAIALKNCRNVIFRDFTVYHGGHFAILGTAVDNWTIDNVTIDTNRDGIDIDCCVNVRVSNCSINTPHDDGLCLKSSYALGFARATENVAITNCFLSGFVEGTLLDGTRQRAPGLFGVPFGRIKLGTESNGGFRNIAISNCVFEFGRGLAFESVDGAIMEDITISNISMRDIGNAPIFIRLGARLRGPGSSKVGAARRIRIADVVAHNVTAQSGILIAGIPQAAVEDVSLSNILITYAGGGTKQEGERIVPEYEKAYPEPEYFGTMPAWGLWARHVVNLSVHHVEFHREKPDLRPAIGLDDVAGASFGHVQLPLAEGADRIVLKDVADISIHASPGISDMVRTGKGLQDRIR